ncbi:hypothetical protein [Ferruginibacter profundus]
MKTILTTMVLVWITNFSFGQTIKSGEYEFGLKLAFDSKTQSLTGYFENYTGWDEETKNPKFSCIFYIEGVVTDNKFQVLTYHPGYKSDDTISGLIEIVNDSTLKINLPSEHGGCWNVQHFADQPVEFDLEKKKEWTAIKYVAVGKAYFYSEKSGDKKQKAYIVKNDFVCIDRTEGDWAYCTYFGKRKTKGWIKIADLNKI